MTRRAAEREQLMGEKQALIVDDSKSARLFLTRILEKYGITVDSVDSAEAAIAYLESERPDVIFMDHLMPGMDGFQALRAIKTDPRTATIPIMMYTSQEGELYLGQARALGAIGVLPKQIRPADVSKVLYQLHLVADRRSEAQSTFRPLEATGTPETSPRPFTASNTPGMKVAANTSRSPDTFAAAPRFVPSPAPPSRPPGGEQALREQLAELRRALGASLEVHAERIVAEIRGLARPQPPARSRTWIAALGVLAVLVPAAMATLAWRERTQLAAARTELALLRQAVADRAAMSAASVHGYAAPVSSQSAPQPMVLDVPYGGEALGGSRLRRIRALLERLASDHVSGIVSIRTYAGRFCLAGDPVRGYALAPPAMPYSQCAVVGNPAFDDSPPEQRMPLALADLIGAIRGSTHGTLDVETAIGDPGNVRVPYPPITDDLTAGEWNKAGRANNRVEIQVR